jgi:NAD(P)-dependent dehydrogenase (short-subunit alcohol dehydrogenase family)
MPMSLEAMSPGHVAVITGGASGIGLGAAMRFAKAGMKVCIADIGADRLSEAAAKLSQVATGGAADVMTAAVDVSQIEQLRELEGAVRQRFGGTDVLMNNAGIQPGSQMFGPAENWQRILGVNLWGVINGSRIFAPQMVARGRPGLIINTGSKQGITTPPGDPAYNVSKAGVKAFTEALQHELRGAGSRISAHLLIPGFVFTGLTARGRTEKPAGAWTAEQTVDFMVEKLGAGDFYILCPDNDVPRRRFRGGGFGGVVDARGSGRKTGGRSAKKARSIWSEGKLAIEAHDSRRNENDCETASCMYSTGGGGRG